MRKPQRAWQRMLSGRRLDLLDPSPLDVEIEDIAHGLARVARWNGQTSGDHAFSVAQHSLLVEHIVAQETHDPAMRLIALLHDAPEYVIGDMISPFKAVMGGGYKAVEERLQGAVHLRFQLPALMPSKVRKRIKKADLIAAWFEATRLAGFKESEADILFGRPRSIAGLDDTLKPRATQHVQNAFLERFAALERQRADDLVEG